jgi:phage shock protein A
MSLPFIDVVSVDCLIEAAINKISHYEKKIENIRRKISEMGNELEAVSAMVEYLSLHEERSKLVGLFRFEGEYGTAGRESEEFANKFIDRKEYLEKSIPRYNEHLIRRTEQIAFMKHDIELLEKIKRISSLSPWRDALNIDM